MIFIDNKYTKWYYNIISNANTRLTKNTYTESHHIIPKSLGGSNEAHNLVNLTAKEHYMCHRLLPKMLTGGNQKKMLYALYCITHVRNKGQISRYIPNARLYAKIKEDWRSSIKGRPAHNKGKPMTIEQKEKLRLANLGKPSYIRTAETNEKMSKIKKGKSIPKLQGRVSNRKGIACSEEQKEKTRRSMLGKNTGPRSAETIEKMKGAKRRVCRLSDKKEMSVNVFNRKST
jgi:hypothetical protein